MLNMNEEKYQVILESIDEGFCIIEVIFDDDNQPVDYLFLETNPAFEKQTGLKNSEGKSMRKMLPYHEDYWFETFASVARTGKPERFENYASELNRWFNVYAFRFGKPEENKVALLFRDITERKQVQQEREQLLGKVKTEQDTLDDIFYNAPSFMCVLRGPDFIFERANKLYKELIGIDDLIGKPVREAVPEAEEQGFIELLDRVYQTGKPFRGSETPIVLNKRKQKEPNRETRYLDFVFQPLRNSEGEINRIFVQGIDLTEQKHAKDELQSVNERLEERVKERTETLLSYQKQLRSLVAKLSKTEEHERQRLATELNDKLGQVLTIGKIKIDQLQTSGSPESFPALTELEEILNDAIRYTRELMLDLKPPPSLNKESLMDSIMWVKSKMEKNNLKVTVDNDKQPKPLAEEVITTIRQCVRELLYNVVKHAGVGEAHISLSRQDEQVRVTVEDKGAGFDPDGKAYTSDDEKGFGLFNILERMDLLGGSFEIHSTPGKGTKAILSAPVKREKSELKHPETISGDQSQNPLAKAIKILDPRPDSKIRVLLVDDHKMMREGLKKIIKEEEDILVIAEASDGKEAVNIALESKPDVIVMDVNMPLMNGIEATRKITEENPDVRIIGLSLHDSNNVHKAMKKAGASAYLTKTEAIEELCATIRREAPVSPKK